VKKNFMPLSALSFPEAKKSKKAEKAPGDYPEWKGGAVIGVKGGFLILGKLAWRE